MNAKRAFKRVALTLAGASLFGTQANLMAAGTPDAPAKPASQSVAILDVALAQGGSLRGQVVNTQGAPVQKSTVSVQSAGREVASTVTNERGEFSVSNLRGGNYTIKAGDSAGVYRLWTANAAPPAAKSGVLLVSGRQIARGQSGTGFTGRTGLMVLGAAAGIVAGGVTQNDDDSSS